MAFAPVSVNSSAFYTVGQVEIAPDVVIAPGVILSAEPGHCLYIAAGVCLGASVIIQACWGDLRLEADVCVGSGTLIMGQGLIAQGACIGSETTIINPAIAANNTIAPGSLMGDRSRQPANPELQSSSKSAAAKSVEEAAQTHQAPSQPPPANPDVAADSVGLTSFSHVYGKQQVNQLLNALFPERQSLNNSNGNGLNSPTSDETS